MSEEIIRREFPVELTPVGDGRTLELRIVPYNTVARVSDNGGEPYEEAWMPGAFDKQLNAANRVLVNFEHEQGFAGVVGRGTELRSTTDSLDGTFRILQGADGDKALELVNEGVLTGVSLEAIPTKSVRDENGIVQRVKARLVNIALCRFPAFKDAQVLAVREGEPDDEPEPDPEPVPDPEPEPVASERTLVDEMLERVGFQPLLQRAVTRRPWDGSAARFDDEEYKRSCLIDRGGEAPVKERCSLPVLEPNGDINANALGAAAGALAGARGGLRGVTMAQKAAAARRLIRYYTQADMEPPASLRALAGR